MTTTATTAAATTTTTLLFSHFSDEIRWAHQRLRKQVSNGRRTML